MTKIFVLGKTGQLTTALQEEAKNFSIDLRAVSKEEADIRDKEAMKKAILEFQPQILINTSAYQPLQLCEENPEEAFLINAIAVFELAKLCKEKGILFLTYSSDYVFDGEKGSPYQEDDIPRPLQIYGVSKLAGEHAAMNVYPEGSVVIRTAGMYGGVSGSPQKGNFVINFLRDVKGKDTIEVSKEQIVSPTSARDLARASLQLIAKNASSGIYHLVNEGHCSWHQFSKTIAEMLQLKIAVIPVDRGGKDQYLIRRPKFSALLNTKAKSYGIVLHPWEEALKKYLHELQFHAGFSF